MPASSVSGMNSWGVYLVSALALLVMLTPELAGVAQGSRVASDRRELDGVRATLDSLQPGVAINFTFGAGPSSDPIRIGGHQLSCSSGTVTTAVPSRWLLPNATLYPSVRYLATLAEGEVRVTSAG